MPIIWFPDGVVSDHQGPEALRPLPSIRSPGISLISSASPSLEADICRAARALINWSVSRLAREAGVSSTVIFDLERGREIDDVLAGNLRDTFRNAGIVIVMCGDQQIGVQKTPGSTAAPSETMRPA